MFAGWSARTDHEMFGTHFFGPPPAFLSAWRTCSVSFMYKVAFSVLWHGVIYKKFPHYRSGRPVCLPYPLVLCVPGPFFLLLFFFCWSLIDLVRGSIGFWFITAAGLLGLDAWGAWRYLFAIRLVMKEKWARVHSELRYQKRTRDIASNILSSQFWLLIMVPSLHDAQHCSLSELIAMCCEPLPRKAILYTPPPWTCQADSQSCTVLYSDPNPLPGANSRGN